MRRRTPALHLPIGTIDASPCPAPNLVTKFTDTEEQGYFESADFHDGSGEVSALSEKYTDAKDFFNGEMNETFTQVEIPQGTTLYHWRSSVYPRMDSDGRINVASLARLPPKDLRAAIHTDGYLYTNTDEGWMYNPTFDDYFQSNTVPMGVLMRIRIETPVVAWKDDVPMLWEECEKDPRVEYPFTPHHSDIVLPPSTFVVTGVSELKDMWKSSHTRAESNLQRSMRRDRRSMRKFPVYDRLFAENNALRVTVIDLTLESVTENVDAVDDMQIE